jgi:hypothetical protein
VCLHLSVVTFRYDILFPLQKQCYVVLSTITKYVEIQRAPTLVHIYSYLIMEDLLLKLDGT